MASTASGPGKGKKQERQGQRDDVDRDEGADDRQGPAPMPAGEPPSRTDIERELPIGTGNRDIEHDASGGRRDMDERRPHRQP